MEFEQIIDDEFELNEQAQDMGLDEGALPDADEQSQDAEAVGEEAQPQDGGQPQEAEADEEPAEDVAPVDGEEPAEDVAPADGEAAPSAIPTSFGTVTDRLTEIADVVADDTMPLDDALDLLEEAVSLGMQASNLLESDMEARNAADEDDELAEGEAAESAEAPAASAAPAVEGAEVPAAASAQTAESGQAPEPVEDAPAGEA